MTNLQELRLIIYIYIPKLFWIMRFTTTLMLRCLAKATKTHIVVIFWLRVLLFIFFLLFRSSAIISSWSRGSSNKPARILDELHLTTAKVKLCSLKFHSTDSCDNMSPVAHSLQNEDHHYAILIVIKSMNW